MNHRPDRRPGRRSARRMASVLAAATLLLAGCGVSGEDDANDEPDVEQPDTGTAELDDTTSDGDSAPDQADPDGTGEDAAIDRDEEKTVTFLLPTEGASSSGFGAFPDLCEDPDATDAMVLGYGLPDGWEPGSVGGSAGYTLRAEPSWQIRFYDPDDEQVLAEFDKDQRNLDDEILVDGEPDESFDTEGSDADGNPVEYVFEERWEVDAVEDPITIWEAVEGADDEFAVFRARIPIHRIDTVMLDGRDRTESLSYRLQLTGHPDLLDEEFVTGFVASLTVTDCARDLWVEESGFDGEVIET